jgi:hypothetical protein
MGNDPPYLVGLDPWATGATVFVGLTRQQTWEHGVIAWTSPRVPLPGPTGPAPVLRHIKLRPPRRDWKLVEVCCPPPVPVELASRPPVVLPPAQARPRPARLARLYGGSRERRAVRSRLERKDAA